jgi:3-oxoacyl-[acyl-carrier protein] reductase
VKREAQLAAVAAAAAATADQEATPRRSITYHAIAPGFIETDMVGTIPFFAREAGRRMNAFSQGGLPEDIASAVAFFAHPQADGLSGCVLRVCGGHMLGR